jgi:proteasome lid subunit RPN8/RPN11
MSEPVPITRQEIIFGTQVSLQSAVSILEMPFPSGRTLHWVPKSTRLSSTNLEAGPEDVHLVVAQEVILATSRHVSQTLERELGGFLLGNRYRCPTGRIYVIIDQFMEGEYTESNEVSLHFTHESWRRLEDKLGTTYLGKALVGWYHSHPKMNVFLSRDDLSIHERRFSEPWKSALVLEPEKHFGGFFCWRSERLNQHVPVDFYELLRDDTRKTVVAWENYTGVDPVKNVTPPLAEINTKTVQPSKLVVTSRQSAVRARRSWMLIVLAAISFGVIAVVAMNFYKPQPPINNSSTAANKGPIESPTPGTSAGEDTQTGTQPASPNASGVGKPGDNKGSQSAQPQNKGSKQTQDVAPRQSDNPSRRNPVAIGGVPTGSRTKPPTRHRTTEHPATLVGRKGIGG